MEKVLVVDDDDLNRDLLATILSSEYDVMQAENGEAAIEIALSQIPDMILLDIQMPGIDGYQTCQRIKANPATENCPVIFVSANENEGEIIRGYEVGAVDYMVKPFKPNELMQKVKLNLALLKQKKEWEERLGESGKLLLNSMTDTVALNRIGQFNDEVAACASYPDVAEKFIDIVKGWGLNCTLQIRDVGSNQMFSSSSSPSSMEEKVISVAASKGKVIDYGKRTIVNGSNCSILIKNMPLEDKDKYVALKTYLAFICDGIDARISAIKSEAAIEKYTMQLQRVFQFVLEYFRAIEGGNNELHTGSIEIVRKMCENLGLSISEIVKVNDLSEETEKKITDVGDACLKETNYLFAQGQKFNDHVTSTLETLERMLSQPQLSETDFDSLIELIDKVDIYKFKRDIKKGRGG